VGGRIHYRVRGARGGGEPGRLIRGRREVAAHPGRPASAVRRCRGAAETGVRVDRRPDRGQACSARRPGWVCGRVRLVRDRRQPRLAVGCSPRSGGCRVGVLPVGVGPGCTAQPGRETRSRLR
jgi:hypothetical protein